MSKSAIRFFDILLSALLLPFASAIFLTLLLPQVMCLKGIFYVSIRTGQGGRKYRYVKLKSMRGDSGASQSGSQSGSHGRAYLEEWRIPAWGRFLRKSHLDEIPELALILAGRESFVGPRPLLPEHIALVDSPERKAAKPGWTGLSQIYLKTRGILPSRVQRRLDQKLGAELNIRLYFRILCATIFAKKRKPGTPGPTVMAYRQSIQASSVANYGGNNENP
jgi:lipopolysaccharide/colanic/teichoic acid biosynthesis glycosyltransferase